MRRCFDDSCELKHCCMCDTHVSETIVGMCQECYDLEEQEMGAEYEAANLPVPEQRS